MNDLLYTLGLDITDFKASAKAANDQADGIKRGIRNIKDVIGAGGVGIVVLGFFRFVVQHAMEAKGEVDANTAAVQRFGQAIEQNKKEAMDWGAQFLGTINRVGESMGNFARIQIEGGMGFWGNLIKGNFKDAMGAYGKAYRDVMREHERDIELSKEEARLAVEKQKYATEDKRLRSETASLAQQEQAASLARLTVQERVNVLGNTYWRLTRELAQFEGDALARRQKENDVRKAGLDLFRAQSDLLRENEQNEKKSAEAAKRAAEDREKALDLQAKKEAEIAKLRLKGVENLTEAEKVQLDLLEGRLTQRQAEKEIQTLLKKGVENLTEEEKKRLAALVGQTAEIDKQVKKVAEQAKIIMSMNVRGVAQFKDASEEELKDLIRKAGSQISRNQELMFRQADMTNLTTRMDIARLQQERANAQQELAFRRTTKRDYDLGGEDYARSRFQGNPLLFDDILARLRGNWDKQDETNDLLKKQRQSLDAGFARLAEQLKASARN